MVVENVSSVKGLRAVGALELFLLHVCLDVPLQDLDLGELLLAELAGEGLDQAITLLLLLRVESVPAFYQLVLLVVSGFK